MPWIAPAIIGGTTILSQLLKDDETGPSQTYNTNTVPDYAKGDIQRLWTDFMNQMYPSSPSPGVPGMEGMTKTPTGISEDLLIEVEQHKREMAEGAKPDVSPQLEAFMAQNGLSLTDDIGMFRFKIANPTPVPDTTGAEKGKSYEEMLAENLDFQKGATETYNTGISGLNKDTLAKTQGAVKPYTDLLNKYVTEGQAGAGLFKPMNISFGGTPALSFVPRSNRNLATQLTGFGRDSAEQATNLLNLENTYGATDLTNIFNKDMRYTPNAAKTDYIKNILQPLAVALLTGQGTSGQQSTTPGQDPFADLLASINAGSNLYGNIMRYQPRTNTNTNANTDYNFRYLEDTYEP